jgi:hypothetical protein
MSTGTGTELYGGMTRQKKVARPVRKLVRAVGMAKPKKAPVRQRAYDKRLLKHFGGFFSELEGFAEQMSKVEHLTPGAKKPTAAAVAANFTNYPPTRPTSQTAQEGGVYKKKRRPVVNRGPARRQSRGGTGLEEEFGILEDSMNVVDSIAKPVANGMSTTAQTFGITSGGARPRARRAVRAVRPVSPAYRASFRAGPVVRRPRRSVSPRRR